MSENTPCLAVVRDNDRFTTRCALSAGHGGEHSDTQHVREVLAVHEGYGEEAWCPACREHWPCAAMTAKALE